MNKVQRAAQLLRSDLERFDEPIETPSLTARARAIDAISVALEKRGRPKHRGLWLGAVAAALLLVVISAGLIRAAPGAEEAVMAGMINDVARAVRAGEHFETSAQRDGLIRFPTGTQIDVSRQASIAFEALGKNPRLRLERGAVVARVAKLHEGETFRVLTADTEVEVKGTVFSVELASDTQGCEVATTTRVRVDEGKVWLRHRDREWTVKAGERWPACQVAAASPAPQLTAPLLGTEAPHITKSPPPPPRSTVERAPGRPASKLSEQNDAFERAGAALRRGEWPRAVRGFVDFRKRFPNSPLAEDATVELMRLYREQGHRRAADEARAYLNRWPNGYAHTEAEDLLRGR